MANPMQLIPQRLGKLIRLPNGNYYRSGQIVAIKVIRVREDGDPLFDFSGHGVYFLFADETSVTWGTETKLQAVEVAAEIVAEINRDA